jgi:hypothetical protein
MIKSNKRQTSIAKVNEKSGCMALLLSGAGDHMQRLSEKYPDGENIAATILLETEAGNQ